ncbi:hypothetical protein DS2_09117 [Catenovulum agarivorans DS-2]|uniref:Uncharacterized protein n=1 Tax=Catenovulum agarivorans DS-2 TaxID=1328313 RepID=W7QMS7_9ALTE|nr:hypothetical protein [Catenovulum agarivorans]EWH10247.1 hypothetical protein DS2_09117 [Catenovulum agarivorans DS-2]
MTSTLKVLLMLLASFASFFTAANANGRAADGDIATRYIGSWQGAFDLSGKLYSVDLTIQRNELGRYRGFIRYQGCQALLVAVPSIEADALSFVEHRVRGKCIRSGLYLYSLKAQNKTLALYKYYVPNFLTDKTLTFEASLSRNPELQAELGALLQSNAYKPVATLQAWSTKPDTRFRFANHIEITSFQKYAKRFNGLVEFSTKEGSCVGELKSDVVETDILRVNFIDAKCADLNAGYFSGYSPGRFLNLHWNMPKDKQALADQYYSGLRLKPDKVKYAHRTMHRNMSFNGRIIRSLVESFEHERSQRLIFDRYINQIASGDYSVRFQSADMVGGWSGVLAMGNYTFSVEAALWPTSLYNTRHVAGLLWFVEAQCQLGFLLNSPKKPATANLTFEFVPSSQCLLEDLGMDRNTLYGGLKLSSDKNNFILNLQAMSSSACSNPASNKCHPVGLFSRSIPSYSFQKLIKQARYELIDAPSYYGELAILKGKPLAQAGRKEHNLALNKSEQYRQKLLKIRQEAEMAARKREQRIFAERERYQKIHKTAENMVNTAGAPPNNNSFADEEQVIINFLQVAAAVLVLDKLTPHVTEADRRLPQQVSSGDSAYDACYSKVVDRLNFCTVSVPFDACDASGCSHQTQCDGEAGVRDRCEYAIDSDQFGDMGAPHWCDPETSVFSSDYREVVNAFCR